MARAIPHLYVRMIGKGRQMKSPDVLLALVRCELKARYNGLDGWQVSAKGALPVLLILATLVIVLMRDG
jgi:hypothetical protein